MTDRDTLAALVARVEAATTEDRYALFRLGVDVQKALGRPINEVNPALSLDAAVALVPEGAGIELRRYWMASREDAAWSALLITGLGDQHASEDRPTAALALTAAALRARMEARDAG